MFSAAQADPHSLPADVKQKLKLHEDLMSVLHGEILRCIQQIESLSKVLDRNEKFVKDGNTRVQVKNIHNFSFHEYLSH